MTEHRLVEFVKLVMSLIRLNGLFVAVGISVTLLPCLWSVSGGVVVSVRVWLLGCNCLCAVTPQGGVLWHAVGEYPCICSSISPGAVWLHLKMIVKVDRRKKKNTTM